jgi:hypothetical protein
MFLLEVRIIAVRLLEMTSRSSTKKREHFGKADLSAV